MKKWSNIFKSSKKFDNALKEIENIGEDAFKDMKISKNIHDNYQQLKSIFKDCYDIVFRRIKIGSLETDGFIVYISGLTDMKILTDQVLNSLMIDSRSVKLEGDIKKKILIDVVDKHLNAVANTNKISIIKDVVNDILIGHCLLFIDGNDNALGLDIKTYESRNVSTPITESVIRGPMEAFNENLQTNTALLRNRVKTPNLKMEKYEIGTLSKTSVIMTYIHGLVDISIIKEVKERLKKIDVDMINDSGEIEPYLEDDTFSPFPQVGVTERPDTVAAALAEGRVAILVNGSPFALVVPNVFIHFMSSAEDNYGRFYFVSFIRILRYFSLFIALFLPAIYIALITYHQEMIPSALLITISSLYAGIPFPAVVEALLLEFTFEILREAGVRLPKPVGQAVNIVGALIIGEAAVQAGIASRSMVVIVAFTGITSFVLPGYNAARTIRILRFFLIILGSTFGIFGVIIGGLFLLVHMCSVRSLGVPYLSPLSPIHFKDWTDVFIKFPSQYIRTRPTFIQKYNVKNKSKSN